MSIANGHVSNLSASGGGWEGGNKGGSGDAIVVIMFALLGFPLGCFPLKGKRRMQMDLYETYLFFSSSQQRAFLFPLPLYSDFQVRLYTFAINPRLL